MNDPNASATSIVGRAPLPWLVGGLLLGLVQVLAVALQKPLGVSTQFVVADTIILGFISPDFVANHDLISAEKYRTFGYGWWLDVGLIVGAFLAAVVTRNWKLSLTPVWWIHNHGRTALLRLLVGFIGGFLILLGARLAHGCTSGQFASGWAQLSLSAVPFTITLFGFGMLTAWLVYPKTPEIEGKGAQS